MLSVTFQEVTLEDFLIVHSLTTPFIDFMDTSFVALNTAPLSVTEATFYSSDYPQFYNFQ